MKRQIIDGFSDGQNCNGNFMRPGSLYVDDRNDQIRYVDKDGTEQWCVPVSAYFASEEIKRGEAVSISSRGDLINNPNTRNLSDDIYPYVHKTNPDEDESCLGLALNYATKGQLVHVQNTGTIRIHAIDGEYSDGSSWSGKEVIFDGKETDINGDGKDNPQIWGFKNVSGQKVYVKKPEYEDGNVIPETCGKLTFDFKDSVYTAKHTIQIGYFTDGPLESTYNKAENAPDGDIENPEDLDVWIELDVTGDTRGPLENTQFLVELAEPFTVTEEDSIRCFSIGQSSGAAPKISFNITTSAIEKIKNNLNDISKNKKIFFSAKRSFLEKNEETSTSISTSYSVVPFFRHETGGTQEETTTNVVNSILNEVNNPEDKSFIGVISYNGFDGLKSSLVNISDVVIEDPQTSDNILPEIAEAIKNSFNALLSDKEKEKVEWSIINKDGLTIPIETSSSKFNVQFELINKDKNNAENNNYIGSFEYYFSEGLSTSSDIEITEQNSGSESNAGKAIISDIRTLERSNVFGVYCGGDYGREHLKGEIIALMKMGTIILPGKQTVKELNFTNEPLNDEDTFKNGGVYYLGINGRVYRNLTNLYYDKVVQIAQQIGENEKGSRIVVNVSDAMTSTADNGGYPIGFIKQAAVVDLNDGTQTFGAEYGYLVCDGVTKYSTATYKDLYEFLLSVYPQSFLVDDDSPSEFTIPKITLFIPDGTQTGGVKEVYAQIKAIKDGIFREIPRLPFIRKKLQINEAGKINDIDITSLVRYGTLEETTFPTIDNINIQLYVKDQDGNWRELQKGFNLYNNTILYGYDWLVDSTKDNFTLKMDIADGIGISKVTTTTPPIPMIGSDCVVTVTMKNLWAREYRDIKETIEDKIIDDIRWLIEENQSSGTTVVPSAKATYDFVKDKVETKELKVFNEDGTETFTSTNNNSVVTGNFLINDVFKVELGDDGYKAYYKANNGAFIELLTRESIDSHISESIEDPNKIIHGIKNTGADGNIDAAKVSGYSIGTYSGVVTQNNTDGSYIPYVNSTSKEMKVGAGIEYGVRRVSGTDPSQGYFTVKNNNIINTGASGNSITTSLELFKNDNQVATGIDKYIIGISPTAEYKYLFELNGQMVGFYVSNNGAKDLAAIKVKSIDIGDTYSISNAGNLKINNVEAHSVKSGTVESNTLYSQGINIGTPSNSKTLEAYIQENSAMARSSIAYKKIVSEYVINEAYKVAELASNVKKDGNPLTVIEMDDKWYEENDTLFESLGSALQILHELPLSKFKYKEELNAKDYLGILVERVNVAKQKFEDTNVTISHPTIFGMGYYPKDGKGNLLKPYEKYNNYKTYTYTDEEKEKIAESLDIITDNKELSQNIISSIGLLLKAAHEAQDRLINLETSVFGFDCKPGDNLGLENIIDDGEGNKVSGIAEDLRDQIIQLPLLLGLNRIVRALCLEVFNDADYSYIEGEDVGPGTTVKSRIDFIEDELNKLKNQYIEFLKYFQNEHYALFKKILLTECEVDEADPTSITIMGDNPNWDTLPSKEQYTTPTENTGENIGSYNEATNGTCKPIEADVNTVNELQVDNNGYIVLEPDGHPSYTGKKYLSLESKVERLNMKLSQLTKSLYGVDDPLYTSPNRLEVIRRNIAALYKEVYFNDLEYGEILNKIEPIITDDTGAPIDGVDIRKPFEKLDTDGSFIDSIIDQFYSFDVKQNLAENTLNIDTTQYTYKDFKDNNFNKAFSSSKVVITDGQFVVSNDGLVPSKEDNSLSYSNAITILDLLRERIGEDYTWYKLLYKAKDCNDIIDALTNDEGDTGDQPVLSSSFKIIENKNNRLYKIDTTGIEDDPLTSIINNYKAELTSLNKFYLDEGSGKEIWKNINLDELSSFYLEATDTESYLSRKERAIEPRLTSLESCADAMSSKELIVSENLINGFDSKENNLNPDNYSYSLDKKQRFEQSNVDSISYITDTINLNSIFNLNNQFNFEVKKQIIDSADLRSLLSHNIYRFDNSFYYADLNPDTPAVNEAEEIYRNNYSLPELGVKSIAVYINANFEPAFSTTDETNLKFNKKIVVVYYKSDNPIEEVELDGLYYPIYVKISQNTTNIISNIERPDIDGSILTEDQKTLFKGILDNGIYTASDLGLNEYLNALNHNDLLYNIVNLLKDTTLYLNELKTQAEENAAAIKELNDNLGNIDYIGKAFTFNEEETVSNKRFKTESLVANNISTENLTNFQSNIFQTDQFKTDTYNSKDFRDNLATNLFTKASTPFDNIFYKNLINTIYPVGCTYTQYPVGKDFVDSQKPANLWPGTQWELVFNGDGVFFRTEGGNSNEDRSTITGIQEDSIKEHSHGYSDYHIHGLSGTLGSDQGDVESNIQSGGAGAILKFNIKTGGGGEHSHTGSTDYNSESLNHVHPISKIARDGVGGSGSIRLSNYNVQEGPKYTDGSGDLKHKHKVTTSIVDNHIHSFTQTITLNSAGRMDNYTGNFGETETRPKNRLFRIWRRTL